MFKNYLKTSWRFLLKNKTFSLINIFGLSVGTMCCLYILLYVQDQFSYDRHHTAAQDIYRINKRQTGTDGSYDLAITGPSITPAMKRDFPEVLEYTRVVPFLGVDKHLLIYEKVSVYERDAFFADSTFFDVFSYHFLEGDEKALSKPYSVVLLNSTANKLFGKASAVGKTIVIDNVHGKHRYTVRGVVDEELGKSHLHANILISMNSGDLGEYSLTNTSWTNNNFIASYIKLRPGTDRMALEKKFPGFVQRYGGEQLKAAGLKTDLYLQPIRSIHTTAGLDNPGIGKPVSASFLGILALIAGLIQLIACINFMNLSTARASKRAKEVGVRKVIGAGRRDLISQFLGESFLLSLISVLLALPLMILLLPYLNEMTQSDIQVRFLKDYRLWLLLVSLILVTGLLAGSYPAFYLSAFRVIKVIKGNFTSEISAVGIRRSLVVFQFVLSIVLITGIIVIYSQLNYIRKKDLGFSKDQRIIFTFNSGDAFDKIPAFMNDLRQLAGVKEVSNASKYISNPALFSDVFVLPGQSAADAKYAGFIVSDEYFVRANGVHLLSGRDFRSGDSAKVLVNETFARKMGIDPLKAGGVRITDSHQRVWEIVGVMKDFNYGSLHKDVESFMVWINYKPDGLWSNLTVHIAAPDYRHLLSEIETVWRKDIPGVPFEFSFMDEQVQKLYAADLSMSRTINLFTLAAVFISCLGLFGLAAFNAEQRSREIGIRKVLGASVPGIVRLLSADFLRLIVLAFVIAVPISWWTMNQWLNGFAFKVQISWWMFATAGVVTMLIAVMTVSSQAIRSAYINPVKALQSE